MDPRFEAHFENTAEGFPREEFILPDQFQGLWHGKRKLTPERELMLHVLWQAADDLSRYRLARQRKRRQLYLKAFRWVASNDRSWPFSFVNICEELDVSPTALRHELLDQPSWMDQAA